MSDSSGEAAHPLLTPRDVRRLLAAHAVAPRKTHGQNFVVDPNTVRKTVRDAGVRPGELVCEVGPGVGSLTRALRAAGARVVAVEIDAGLVRVLQTTLGWDPQVRVVHGDALSVDLAVLVDGGPAAFVANLPYNVATPLVLDALAAGVFTRLHVMVQREVGERWAARVGGPQYGAVSVKMAAFADVAVVAAVSRAAFYPVPNVESVTVRLVPRPWAYPVDRAGLFRLVGAGFSQRRKRLRNALGAVHPPGAVEDALRASGLDPGARAEELDLDAWVRLAATLGVR
ncbi:MAG TPA: 16S rRNA (adenine(1518)-N(6)/adenine(1519)-N(6))-dimethyltransferase RsmA [Egibacteraceae bacterium]|nr:16S rRNA (adenine(1518)-N(6)/adenine(1519)-N(6))-dimethyltransferase RsmA [Egibacteraceae bacterium]